MDKIKSQEILEKLQVQGIENLIEQLVELFVEDEDRDSDERGVVNKNDR